MMMYEIERTTQFKKDFKLAIKRGCNMEELKKVVDIQNIRTVNGAFFAKNRIS